MNRYFFQCTAVLCFMLVHLACGPVAYGSAGGMVKQARSVPVASPGAPVPPAPPPPPASHAHNILPKGVALHPHGPRMKAQDSFVLNPTVINGLQQAITAIDKFHMETGTDDLKEKRDTLSDARNVLMNLARDIQEEKAEKQALEAAAANQQAQETAKQKYNTLIQQLGQIIGQINTLTGNVTLDAPMAMGVHLPTPAIGSPTPPSISVGNRSTAPVPGTSPMPHQPLMQPQTASANARQNWNQMSVKQRAAALEQMAVPQATPRQR